MGRPVSHRRRQELALAAFEVIRARGPHGVTMSELADALAMKRSSLYWYFRDLGHVFEVVLDHLLERQRVFLARRLGAPDLALTGAPVDSATAEPHPPRPHPIDLLVAYMRAIWDFFEAEGATLLHLVTFWGHAEGGEPGRVIELTQRHFLPLRSAAVAALEDGQRRGLVAPCDAGRVVDLVAAVVDGALVHRVVRGLAPHPIGELVREAVLEPLRLTPPVPAEPPHPPIPSRPSAPAGRRPTEERPR